MSDSHYNRLLTDAFIIGYIDHLKSNPIVVFEGDRKAELQEQYYRGRNLSRRHCSIILRKTGVPTVFFSDAIH